MSAAEWVGAWSEKRAALSPERVGLVDAATGTEYTYADLDRRANRCARLLADHGVTADPDDESAETAGRVAVVSRNRPEYVDLFFATGKTGGVLAPLSHRLAPRELAELFATVDPHLVVVEEAFAGLVDDAADEDTWSADAPVLSLPVGAAEGGKEDGSASGATTWEPYEAALPDDGSTFDGPAVDADDPHLFLHTGGSTGTPKETVVSHEALVWNSLNTITAWGLRDDDVTPMVFPMFHTGGWNVLTLPIFHMGGTVVVDREFDPGQILGVVDERSATVLVAVPAVLRMMTDHDRWTETDLSSLRFVKSGGGPCRESVMEAWWDRGVDLSQGYGLTECGPNNFAMPDDWPREKAHTVGVANVHVDARVVDDDGQSLPADEIGELQLRSPHAADGYWSSPEESAETFGEWVSTGDLARVDDEGYVSIEGRKKNMFVSGGENVYPAEVEDAIVDHPAVADAVVVPVPDDQWGQVGKAVVELRDGGGELPLDGLREFLDGRLARFKHPRHLAFVDELPTSGPDKIDREAVAAEFGE
ncbi:AMP-binding protein [Halosimplex litoreum]|uniref:AMP-binding protein n=1 Tax=Halosimplex litoreum TaxID=1198301 RepID=A0A7T3FY54_9EURY|nr:AMP-binding protein [Halosimplex litoreum]QPV62870.1 AMP-binding protein [Halosimplex litoreum]